jgi:hypothetical protein
MVYPGSLAMRYSVTVLRKATLSPVSISCQGIQTGVDVPILTKGETKSPRFSSEVATVTFFRSMAVRSGRDDARDLHAPTTQLVEDLLACVQVVAPKVFQRMPGLHEAARFLGEICQEYARHGSLHFLSDFIKSPRNKKPFEFADKSGI